MSSLTKSLIDTMASMVDMILSTHNSSITLDIARKTRNFRDDDDDLNGSGFKEVGVSSSVIFVFRMENAGLEVKPVKGGLKSRRTINRIRCRF